MPDSVCHGPDSVSQCCSDSVNVVQTVSVNVVQTVTVNVVQTVLISPGPDSVNPGPDSVNSWNRQCYTDLDQTILYRPGLDWSLVDP